jgi:acyl carrier protein phosphodiesterase
VLSGIPDPGLQEGCRLHGVIDQVTDRHPAVLGARERLPRELRRASGIILDVYWDHFLSREFETRVGRPLTGFVEEVLGDLKHVIDLAPPETREVLIRMRDEAWLLSYQTPEGIELTLERITRRLSPAARRYLLPARARQHLVTDQRRLQGDFDALWRDLNERLRVSPSP